MGEAIRVEVADGKYTVILDNGKMTFLRHGEPWPAADEAFLGTGLIYALAFELGEARKRIEDLENQLRVSVWPWR